MDTRMRMYAAEAVGTFLLVLFGAGAVCAAMLTSAQPWLNVDAIALAEGCTLAVALTFTSPVSVGCLNPAVTLTLWVFKRLDGVPTACLIASQLAGAILAGLVLRLTFDDTALRSASLGTPHLRPSLVEGGDEFGALLTGVGVETGLTFLVTLAIFATLLDRRGPRLGGVVVGLAQVAAVVLGSRLTGGAANPARWLGPAVWQGTVQNLQVMNPVHAALVYAGGPVLGALLAAGVYTALISPLDKGKEAR
jgi:glycerol uptake facilitator-like aquaporin